MIKSWTYSDSFRVGQGRKRWGSPETWEGTEDQETKGKRQSSANLDLDESWREVGAEMVPSFPLTPAASCGAGPVLPNRVNRVLPRINRGQWEASQFRERPLWPRRDSNTRASLGILSWCRQEVNKEPPCGHWHQVAFPLLGVSMATRQCLRPQELGEGDPL